ncbi:MAG: hypothetical protein IPH82_28045 [Chloroflexi bacterium]|nr:hypothetical protein [Chloroflexota bacterium]
MDPAVVLQGGAGAGVGVGERLVAVFQEGQQRRLGHVRPVGAPLRAVEPILLPQLPRQAAGAPLQLGQVQLAHQPAAIAAVYYLRHRFRQGSDFQHIYRLCLTCFWIRMRIHLVRPSYGRRQ